MINRAIQSSSRAWRADAPGLTPSVTLLAAAITTAAAIAAPSPAMAQEPDEADSECVCVERMMPASVGAFMTPLRRARLGVVLGEETRVDGRWGVTLQRVADGTPAWRAGLRSGDVVVALDDRELGEDPDYDVLELMADVEPGDTVVVRYLRDGEEGTASVVTEAGGSFRIRSGSFDVSDGPTAFQLRRVPGVSGMNRVMPSRWAGELRRVGARYRHVLPLGLELSTVNEELGEYFGTDRGVLVTEVDQSPQLGLRAGDVILAIGGREVRDPAHVRSILASYRDDEAIPFRIVRDQRTTEITGTRS